MENATTLAAATRIGTEREQLEMLALILADAIDGVQYKKDLAPLARQYRETMDAIRALDGGDDGGDNDLDAIIASAPKTRGARAD